MIFKSEGVNTTAHAVSLLQPSFSVEDISPLRMSLLFLLLIPPLPNLVMTSSFLSLARHSDRASANKVCHQLEAPDGGVTVRCSGQRLTQVPVGLTNLTIRLHLDKNLLTFLPADSFSGLFLLTELDLSHNQLSLLEPGCFHGLASSLHFLDLSSNRLTMLDPAVLGDLGCLANLTHNPWHCDCKMQLSLPQLDLDPSSLAQVICESSDIPNLGTIGISVVLLVDDWDLCLSVRRTTDVVMLVTMFLWFSMLFSYLFYYIHQNQEHVRRHMEYLKTLQSNQV